MAVEIVILCPGSKCKKCKRMIKQVEKAVFDSGIEAEIKLLDNLDDMLRYNTYVLPALFINDKKVARGSVPEKSIIIKAMKEAEEDK